MDLFPGELDWVDGVDVDAPLGQEADALFWQYPRVFGEAAKAAQSAGKVEEEGVYRFMQLLLGICPSFDDPAQPYVPSYRGPDGRNAIPSDFTSKDLLVIDQLLKMLKDPAIRSRLQDYRFLVQKPMDYRAAQASIEEALLHVEKVLLNAKAFEVPQMLRRALHLVRLTNQGSRDLGKRTIELTERAIRDLGKPPFGARFIQCLRLAQEYGIGDPQEFIALAKVAADYHKADRGEDVFRNYWTIVLDFEQQLGNQENKQKAHLEMGESYLRQIEIRNSQGVAANMIAAEFAKKALVAFQQGGADDKRIRELWQKQKEYEAQIGDEMGVFSMPIDIGDSAHQAMSHVKSDSLMDALLKLAFGIEEGSTEEIKEQVLELAKSNPLLAILDVSIVDGKGRQTGLHRGLLNLEGQQYKDALRQRMMAHASQWVWGLRAASYINPARVQILREWHPSLEDLVPIVQHNPFIPPGHETIFLRGLHAGLHGDLLLATHLLVPQLENSIRHVLAMKGVPVTKLDADLTEPNKGAGPLLSLPETEAIFGTDNLFEIRGVFYDAAGYNLRHRIAHGMITEAQCASEQGINAWWMILRFCLHPLLGRLDTPPSMSEGEVAGTPTDQPNS
ncbi:MAG: DUF4209 domain-containing protein [Flavobacteriales bacterium]|nr:DUF4209 domain-containing protein [Flavobacteriales bacterium]